MTDEFDPDKLFNEISQAMRDDDGVKLSELQAQETPDSKEPPNPELPDDEEDQPDEDEGKDKKDGPLDDDSDEEDDSDSDDDADKKPKVKELTDEEKNLDDLRKQLEAATKENQALRSQAGRVPSIQRKLTELDKKLEALRAASPSSQTSAKLKPKLDKLLETVKDTDPVLADTIANAISSAIEGVDEEMRTKETETLTLLRDQEYGSYREEQINILLQKYPNAPQVFASPHWSEWKKTQPRHIQELAGSDDAEAVVMAFDRYKADMLKQYPDLATPATTADVKDTPDTAAAEKAKQLEQVRLRKRENSADLGTDRKAVKDKSPTNPQALFDKIFAEETEKNKRG